MSKAELFRLAEIELVYKTRPSYADRPFVRCSQDAYSLFIENWDSSRIEFIEQAKMLLLNNAARVLGLYEISSGGTSATIVDAKQVYIAALKANASSIIIAHNHPSGSLSPSSADIQLTNKISKAGEFLDIKMLDHLIVTDKGYYSFADNNLIP